MEKPDWVLWNDPKKCVTLEECVCLSMDSEPETEQRIPFDGGVRVVRHDHPEFSGVLSTEEGRRRLALLRKHFDGCSDLLRPMNLLRHYLYGSLLETRVILCDFCCWAHAMEWPVPEPLTISSTPVPAIAEPVPVAAEATEQRRARWLDWYGEGERGAVQRVYERELLLNPKADRSYIGKEIDKAKKEKAAIERGGIMFGQLVQDSKRKG